MSLLWAKGGGAPDSAIQAFCAGEDVLVDRHLFTFDIDATRAHAHGLSRIGVLTADDVTSLDAALDALRADFESGAFVLDARFEDGHSAIEAELVRRAGEVGRRVHAGRSRNDQVQVALRLYGRARAKELAMATLDCASACLGRARGDADAPLVGYTHLQRAVPSTVGLWMAAFAEGFVEDAEHLALTARWLDRSPLGTAAGFGVNLPLDRQGVADELGFAALQLNPMNVQSSRGKLELGLLAAVRSSMLDVRRLAWDLSLFTMEELAFVGLPDAFTTGSSIMPNKRNPDVVELLRASAARVLGAEAEIAACLSLPSGYHRDLQGTKEPFVRAVEHARAAIALVPRLVAELTFDKERMRAAISPATYATDRAVELVRDGAPFRDAYRQVAGELASLGARTPEDSVRARVSPGACADLRLDEIAVRADRLRAELST